MYISLLSLLIIGGFIIYFVWQSKRSSDNNLNIVNLLVAVSYLEKNIGIRSIGKGYKDENHRYAFLLQYLQDMQNLQVSKLNNTWIGIYNFFSARTNHNGSGQLIRYTQYGRISANTIIAIADMYRSNSTVIGTGVWEDFMNYCGELGKDEPQKGKYYHPKNIEELIEDIEIYDMKYTGHVLMEKR